MSLACRGVWLREAKCASDIHKINARQAWDTLTWFAALIGMASYLNKFGFIKWFSDQARYPLVVRQIF